MSRANEQAATASVKLHHKLAWVRSPRLGAHAFVLASSAWLLFALLIVILVFSSIPGYVAWLHIPRVASALAPDDPGGQLTRGGMQELRVWGLSLNVYIGYLVACNLLLVLSYLGMGALIVWRTWGAKKDWMALCAAYTLAVFPVNVVSLMLGMLPQEWSGAITLLTFVSAISIPLFACLFPSGRFVPRWTVLLAVGSVVVWGIYAFVPSASSPSSGLAVVVFVFILLILGLLLGIQVYRYRRVSNQVQRQQCKWVFFGLASTAGGYIVWSGLFALLYLHGMFTDVVVRSLFSLSQFLLFLLIPLSIGFAILRHRLWDIDVIINRTLVYGTLTACIAGLYVMVVVSLGVILQAQGNLLISLGATGLVAVLVQPLRERLQRGVNRLLYGQRDDPYTVIARLSQRLKGTLEPDEVFSTIVATVAQALKLPYVAILWQQEDSLELAASYGSPLGELVKIPLIYQAETIGQLQLSTRSPGEALTPADVRLLDELARQAGLAAHTVRLTVDLQAARERLVLAREEERRLLRRELHDGVGPTLASLSQRIDSARNLVSRDPEAAIAQLGVLKAQIKSTIVDIRRVVYTLRPPTLDELGLIPALREYVMHLQGTHDLHICLEAPTDLPELSAAVEVAAYRITLEAMTNVARHADARTCLVRLELVDGRSLQLTISDDGRGLADDYRAGVGIVSMHERVAELGGECTITRDAKGGVHVSARLPLQASRDAHV